MFARIRAEFVDRDATLEETGGKEEAERRRPKGGGRKGMGKAARVSIGSDKACRVSIKCSARRKKGLPDCMKKPELEKILKNVEK